MIGDLCKPLNRGENRTVRIIGNVLEMRVLQRELNKAFGPLKPRVFNVEGTSVDDLRHILKLAIDREDDTIARTRRFKKEHKKLRCSFVVTAYREVRAKCGAPAVLFIRSSNLKHYDHVVRCAAHEHAEEP